jgi:circadian clock protein KaiC
MMYELTHLESGISGLDSMMEGGFPFPSTILVAGAAGTGKTTFGLQFLTHGAERGEKGLYLATLSEPIQWMLRFTQEFEFIKPEYFGEELLYHDLSVLLKKSKNFDEVMTAIDDIIAEHLPQRIVVDPITVVQARDDYREFLYELSVALKNWESVSVLTGEVVPTDPYPVEVAHVVDGIILLSTKETEKGSRQRYLEVLKMRGTNHITGRHLATISSNGLSVQVGI